MTPERKCFITDRVGFVELLDVFGDDLSVVNAARVSFHKESKKLTIGDERLITYLVKHAHVTPFFHPQIKFRIKMPIFLAREWYRHTIGFARNEVSRRYVTDAPQFWEPDGWRKASKTKKQGSSDEMLEGQKGLDHRVSCAKHYCANLYQQLVEKDGVCPELARTILPQSMYTEFIETGSLAAYARLCHLRLGEDAQKEIRDYAELVSQLIHRHFPVCWSALRGLERPSQEPEPVEPTDQTTPQGEISTWSGEVWPTANALQWERCQARPEGGVVGRGDVCEPVVDGGRDVEER